MNWKDGKQVIELAHELGAEAVNLSEYVPAGRGGFNLALVGEELRIVLSDWVRWREEYSDRITIIWHDCRVGMLVPEKDRRDYVGCGAGRLLARILPNGTITPCVFLPTTIGKFPELSFTTIWQQAGLLEQFRERTGRKGNCGSCEHLKNCGGCRAVAYAYSHGDPLAGDPHCWIKPENVRTMINMIEGEGLPI
jgi:radical SAM protein with 4Fe4S-binding SPASM domain